MDTTDPKTALAAGEPEVDTESALARVRGAAGVPGVDAVWLSSLPRLENPGRRWNRGLRLAALVAAAVASLASLVVTGAAASLVHVFEPQTVAPVEVTAADMASLRQLQRYGRFAWEGASPNLRPVDTLSGAVTSSGLPLGLPHQLPAEVAGSPSFLVLPSSSGTFTFDEAAATADAVRTGHSAPSFPSGLDGSQLHFKLGPAAAAVYGAVTDRASGPAPEAMPELGIAVARAPQVTSTGFDEAQLLQVVLSQPGISASLAGELRAMQNPYSTLPIFVPLDMASSRPVTINGVSGILVGDNTGLGAGVIWEKDGLVHAVVSAGSQAEALAVAQSL